MADDTKSENEQAKNLADDYSRVDLSKIAELSVSIRGVIGDLKSTLELVETQVNTVSRAFAGSLQLAQLTRNTLNEATPSVVALGGKLEDVGKIQLGVLKGLQTQAVLNTESYKDIFAAAALAGDGIGNAGDVAAAMIPMFANAGYGINNIGKEMTGILNTAKELGVTAQAVYKGLSDNIAMIQVFNFENGVQGMAKMAANAALLRIDMKTSLGLADKLFNPEAAVEMSAAFQRLGVNVTSLLDPYKLMDMARNDPEKLQEEMGKALKSLTYFDEQSKSIRILPGAQGHLRALAEEMGVGKEELAKWAVNAGDLDRKMREIRFAPSFASDEDRKMIAGMAQLGETGSKYEGKYIVTLTNEKGETEQKLVSELTEADRKAIQEANAPAKSAVDLQVQANGYLRNIQNILQSRQGVISRAIVTNPEVVSMTQTAAKAYTAFQKASNDIIGLQTKQTGDKTGYLNVQQLNKDMELAINTLKDIASKIVQGDVSGLGAVGSEALEKLKTTYGPRFAEFPENFSKYSADYGVSVPIEEIKKGLTKLATEFGIDVDKIIDRIKEKIQPILSAAQPAISGGSSGLLSQAQTTGLMSSENSTVKVDGSISVNVNPTNLEPFIMGILSKSDIASAIYMGNTRTEKALNDYKGSGENPAKAGNLFSPTYNTA